MRASMAMFARTVLAGAVDQIVEDRTGLAGEQLGVKLRPVRGPVDVLIVDRVERPKEN